MTNATMSVARVAAFVGALGIAGLPSVVRADPAGTYAVEGTNPGSGGRYKGTVSVEQTGETYRVIWIINNRQYIGTGIGDQKFIAVSYKVGDKTGLALYGADGGGYTGVWTYAEGTKMGAERWTRQ